MEQEHTPAEIRPNRTVYRFSQDEAICALHDWLDLHGYIVPKGKRFIWLPNREGSGEWILTLGVDHDDPPPKAKGGE